MRKWFDIRASGADGADVHIYDEIGRYMFADPGSSSMIAPWGIRIVESTAIAQGKFLMGAFHLASQIFDRQAMTLDMSESNKDNFSRNMITIRCEERLALAVYRPAAIVYGTLVAPAAGNQEP